MSYFIDHLRIMEVGGYPYVVADRGRDLDEPVLYDDYGSGNGGFIKRAPSESEIWLDQIDLLEEEAEQLNRIPRKFIPKHFRRRLSIKVRIADRQPRVVQVNKTPNDRIESDEVIAHA